MKSRLLVMIEWEDATQHNEGVSEEPLSLCKSAGYAFRKGNAIVLSWHEEDTEWPANSTPGFAIPIGCIRSIVLLKVSRKITPRSIFKEVKTDEND